VRTPLVCAHRGASAHLPDNSRAAFAAAIAMGADAIEADVRRSGDGRLVLAHDPVGQSKVEGLSELAELVSMAAGRVRLDVELKEAGYEREVLAVLEPRPAGLLVSSFLPEAVAAVRRVDPSVRTGLILGPGRWEDPFGEADACGADLLVPNVALLDGALRNRAVADDRPLVVWTVNDPGTLEALLHDPAVGCVITDVPDIALGLR
jgi:glycerophosphoryl diester phosphodiesterase